LFQEIVSRSPKETRRLGERLGRLAQPGDVLLLVGDLGAGKTCLAQGVAWGLDIQGYASSPSFVIVKEYPGRLPLYHIDLYRVDKIEEVMGLGLDDYLYGNGVCIVEWADRGLSALPAEYLLIKLDYRSETERHLSFEPEGKRYLELLSELCNWQ